MATYPFWRISESVTKQELGTFNQLYPYPKYLPRWHTFFSSVDEEVPQEVIVEKTFLDERLLRHIRLQVSLLNLDGGGRCRCGVGGRLGLWRGLHPQNRTSIYPHHMHRPVRHKGYEVLSKMIACRRRGPRGAHLLLFTKGAIT